MTVHLFGDEAGDFQFLRKEGVSRYFLLTTIRLADDHSIAHDLQHLRLALARQGHELEVGFHATSDRQFVRDQVFEILATHDIDIYTTLFDKPKTNPRLRQTNVDFYRSAWFWHLQRVIPEVVSSGEELLLVAGSINLNRQKQAFYDGIKVAMRRVAPEVPYHTAFWPASTDGCIQAADYCGWAIGRKSERGDLRSYDLISSKVRREYDLFASGTVTYY